LSVQVRDYVGEGVVGGGEGGRRPFGRDAGKAGRSRNAHEKGLEKDGKKFYNRRSKKKRVSLLLVLK